jgi:hemerythrin-like domain-containing protein
MADLKNYRNQEDDPLRRFVEKESGGPEYSPMDPPDIPTKINLNEYAPCLKSLIQEHKEFTSKIEEFEKAVIHLKEHGLIKDDEVNKIINAFFSYFDENILPHNFKEEKILFPVLNERLMEKEEYNQAGGKKTAVDMMEDDHIKLIQLSTITFNLFGLCVRLPDPKSHLLVLDLAIEQGLMLIELLRLHIYRENNIVFDLAQKHLTNEELNLIMEKFSKWAG